MAKFRKKPFREWLDVLAKTVVKTRDDFTCQINHNGKCSGSMEALSRDCQWVHIKSRKSNNTRWDMLNAICGCAHCHTWAHDNPDEFGLWFFDKYPYRSNYLNTVRKHYTWREESYKHIERKLLEKAIDLKVDILNVPIRYRQRFIKRIKETRTHRE